ncbi:hypothetical protein IFM89_018055 [Coptis chinensis]|uniref:Ubiquitin-like domain-containing protein n=1 Tax=Coptis chinensis TaxID=261450 RepID=A0A835HWY6_9MAGN|nr:hypothetical protein IFM89_018055 [Coptis chinensis]
MVCDFAQKLAFQINAWTKFKDLKAMVETTFGVPSGQQLRDAWTKFKDLKAMVETTFGVPSGQHYDLDFYNFNTISDVKGVIAKRLGIPLEIQTLIYDGKALTDEKVLKDCKIPMNTTLFFILSQEYASEELNIVINGMRAGEDFEFIAKSSYSIFDIKVIVDSKIGIPVNLQELVVYRFGIMKNWKTLSDYNMGSDSILSVLAINHRVDIRVRKSTKEDVNDTVVVAATSFELLEDILDTIPYELDNVFCQPSLFLDDIRLEENKSLVYYNIGSGTLLKFDRLIQINVGIPSDESVVIDIRPSHTIDEVKDKIELLCGISKEIQVLIHLNDEVLNACTLEDYECRLGSLWALRWICWGVSCSFYWPSYLGSLGQKEN